MPAVLGVQQVWDEGCLDFLVSFVYLLSTTCTYLTSSLGDGFI